MVAALSAFVLYVCTASPAPGWLDSPEFVAQGASLGIAHSPGHPLVGMLGRLATLVPVGDMVWRVHLMSALCGALAAGLAVTLFRSMAPPSLQTRAPHAVDGISMALAGVLALSAPLWTSSIRAEVYALQATLSCGALWGIVRYIQSRDTAPLRVAALCLGLGLANHHLMALLVFLPGALCIVLPRPRPSLRLSLWLMGMGTLGLVALVYLPVRSLAHPAVNFAAPHTLERFVWTVSGSAFSKTAGAEHVSSADIDTIEVVIALAESTTLPLLFLGVFGAYLGLRLGKRWLHVSLIATLACCIFARVTLGFDPETPDHKAYLLPGVLALLCLSGHALYAIAQTTLARAPKAPSVMALAVSLLLPIALVSRLNEFSMRRAWGSDDVAAWELSTLPPDSVLLSAYFQTRFRLWEKQVVEGARPDVAVIDRSFLTYPGMLEETQRQHPELRTLLSQNLAAGSPPPMEALRNVASLRPVFVQLHPNVGATLARELIPAGPFALFAPGAAEPVWRQLLDRDQGSRQAIGSLLTAPIPSEKTDAIDTLLWHDYTRMKQMCFVARPGAAQSMYESAAALAPGDVTLAESARGCGLELVPTAP